MAYHRQGGSRVCAGANNILPEHAIAKCPRRSRVRTTRIIAPKVHNQRFSSCVSSLGGLQQSN